ncbi:MAG: D-alanine--D-alanine ligase [Muribaculaceae bacterium]|nr:D-alanine--D-alanine ligase [Muribaculaceae bacterium]
MKTKVGVFFGGRSTEHEISVISANQAINALDADQYEIVPVYITKEGKWFSGEALLKLEEYKNIPQLLSKCEPVYMKAIYGDFKLYSEKRKGFLKKEVVIASLDVVIPVLHGSNGEDGTFQGVMESIGIPYVGCDVLSSANGMDKIYMKMILKANDIPVVPYYWFTVKNWIKNENIILDEIEKNIGYPVIVKPANLGSSVGIGRAIDRKALKEKITDASKYSSRIIVEHMIEDLQEINCSVLGDCDDYMTSVLEEPIKSGEILSYEDKYMGGSKGAKGMQASLKRIPADLPEDVTKTIQKYAGLTFSVLSCSGVSRVDLIIDRTNNNIYVNEINTIPGSLSFYLWEATGISFTELMNRLVRIAISRKREHDSKIVSYDQNIFNMGSFSGKNSMKSTKLK